jgi:hypothetical protein
MSTIFVYIESAADTPLIGASPTFTYWDKSAPGSPVASGVAMTELVGGTGGLYFVDVTADAGKEYAGIVDATTSAAPGTRYRSVAFSNEAAAVWDEILTGTTHNIQHSAGKKLREIFGGFVIHDGQAQGGTTNSITLDPTASSVDGQYDPAMITIVEGTGIGESRIILEYDGTTKVAIVSRDWRTPPDATTEYIVTAHDGHEHVNEGLARGGASNTITLNTLASSMSNYYVGQHVFLKSGTGQDQTRLITAYDGATKIATVKPDWCTAPDATTGYVMLPFARSEVESTELREAWAALGLDEAAPASFDFASRFIRALAHDTPIDIAISVSGTTVTLTRQP